MCHSISFRNQCAKWQKVFDDQALNQAKFEWFKVLKEGRESVGNDELSGRLSDDRLFMMSQSDRTIVWDMTLNFVP